MNNEILFREKQQFRQWWIWLILLGINGFHLFGVFQQVFGGRQFGDKPVSNAVLLFSLGLSLLLTVLFINLRLDTQIKKDGIYVRFFPFHLNFKEYHWDKISKLFVRQYRPIGEYGGWGLRLGIFGKGKAYNVSGNKGLQIVFTDNIKLLIGTNKPEELRDTLKRLGRLSNE